MIFIVMPQIFNWCKTAELISQIARNKSEFLHSQIADLASEQLNRPVSSENVRKILSLRKGSLPKSKVKQKGKSPRLLEQTILQIAKGNPNLNDTEIVKVIEQTLQRTVNRITVRKYLRCNGIESPYKKNAAEVRNTVLQIAKDNPHTSQSKIAALVVDKLQRHVSLGNVSQILRRNSCEEKPNAIMVSSYSL